MSREQKNHGFSLVELLLVLAIIGIISAVAIPRLTGQRDRAKKIGDAQANGKALTMMLESRKAETGTYGTAGTVATWTPAPNAAATALLPQFTPSGSTQMVYNLTINTPLTYTLVVRAGTTSGPVIYTTDQTGK